MLKSWAVKIDGIVSGGAAQFLPPNKFNTSTQLNLSAEGQGQALDLAILSSCFNNAGKRGFFCVFNE